MEEFKIAPLLDSDFSQYKNIDDFKRRMEQIKKIAKHNLTAHQIINLLLRDLCFIPSNVGYLSPEDFNNRPYYRVRLNVPDNQLSFPHAYTYPPRHICKANGRGNIKNTSVFYCSSYAMTSVLESRPKAGDIVFLSVWRGFTQNKIKFSFFLQEDLNEENPWSNLVKDYYTKLREQRARNHSDKYIFTQEISNFIADMFLKEGPPYQVTSSISNEVLFGENYNDFLVYPSNAHRGSMCNYAFHPKCVDQNLAFEKVIRFRIEKSSSDEIGYSTGAVGEMINGKMRWRNHKADEADLGQLPAEYDK